MAKKERISTNQYVWMLFIIITSYTTLQILAMLIFHAGRDAWLSVVAAWFLDVLLAVIYAYMGIRFPGQNMIGYSITILGKYFGRIIGLMFSIFFLIVASLLMRSISMLLGNMILPSTPITVIIFFGYLLVCYAVKKGIEVIARACEVLGPVYLFMLVLLIALILPIVKINRLKPQFMNGAYPSVSGSMFILSYIGICIIMGMYIPVCERKEDGFIGKFTAVSLGTSITCALVALCIGVFGAEQAGDMVNVGSILVMMIDIGEIFQRVEILWLIIAIGAGIMTVTNLLWAFDIGISEILGLSSYKPIVYPSVLIAFILSVSAFDSNLEILKFAYYSYPFIGIFIETGLEVFLFIMALVLKKKGNPKQNT